jgi:hypothetical protein
MTTYNEEQILEKIQYVKDQKIEFQNAEFLSAESFRIADYKPSELEFTNCTFRERLIISNKLLRKGISFINCKFQMGLQLIDIAYSSDDYFSTILISSCESHGTILIQNCETKSFEIQVTMKKNVLLLRRIKCPTGGFEINNTEAKKIELNDISTYDLTIANVYCEGLDFNKNLFHNFRIKNSSLHVLETSLFNSFKQSDERINYNINIEKCNFNESHFPIQPRNEDVTLEFKDNKFTGECSLLIPADPDERITDTDAYSNFYPILNLMLYNNESEHPIEIGPRGKSHIHNLNIKSRKNTNGNYHFTGMTFESLFFKRRFLGY